MRTIAISSGKGGVGKTTVAVNLGLALGQMGQRTIIFDADLQLANIDVAMGVRAELNLQHVVAGERRLAEIVTPVAPNVGIVVGGSGVSLLMSAGPKRMSAFFDQLESLEESADILLFDTGAGLDTRVMEFVKRADETLLVTTPDPTAISDAYAFTKVALRRRPDAKISLLVNQCGDAREGQRVHALLGQTVERFLHRELGFAGAIRRDEEAARSVRARRPFMLGAPGTEAARDTQRVAQELIHGRPVLQMAS